MSHSLPMVNEKQNFNDKVQQVRKFDIMRFSALSIRRTDLFSCLLLIGTYGLFITA